MDLILWRHAEAKDGAPDMARQLTKKGRNDAARMARWLNSHLPEGCRILVSPAVRTVQTAEALDRKFSIHDALSPGASPQDLLEAAGWPDGRMPVLIVGHQPTLGQLASLLITGAAEDWRIRRSGVWWISQRQREGERSILVRAVIDPSMARIR